MIGAGARVALGRRFVGLRARGETMGVRLADATNGAVEEAVAGTVIGADGAFSGSAVRYRAGLVPAERDAGSPTREFLYVEDCAEAIVLATERFDGPEPVNLGAGVEISIRVLVEVVAELTGFQGRIVWDTSKPNGQPRRCLDVSRAERAFGFRARTSEMEVRRWKRCYFGCEVSEMR